MITPRENVKTKYCQTRYCYFAVIPVSTNGHSERFLILDPVYIYIRNRHSWGWCGNIMHFLVRVACCLHFKLHSHYQRSNRYHYPWRNGNRCFKPYTTNHTTTVSLYKLQTCRTRRLVVLDVLRASRSCGRLAFICNWNSYHQEFSRKVTWCLFINQIHIKIMDVCRLATTQVWNLGEYLSRNILCIVSWWYFVVGSVIDDILQFLSVTFWMHVVTYTGSLRMPCTLKYVLN